jgi:hypothetical protein
MLTYPWLNILTFIGKDSLRERHRVGGDGRGSGQRESA